MLRRLALCYLLIGCHGKAAVVTGGITVGVGIVAVTPDGSSADGAALLIVTGLSILVYGLATLHKGEQKMVMMAPPPPYPNGQSAPYPDQPYPGQPAARPPVQPNQPPPPPEPPLPANELVLDDPRLKQIAIQASAAARHNDCLTAKTAAQQLPPDVLARLRRIDGALVACLDRPY